MYSKFQKAAPTEISYNLDKALPYGGLPNSALMEKFEETPDLGDGEGQYENYARNTLSDFAPDPVSLEQNARRKNYNSKGFLNLIHRGGRGTENTPAHPEMFLGLTEREPRGVATDPDFRNLVRQQEARMRYVRFSADADNSVHHGRWSESEAFNKARVQTQHAIKSRAKIFSTGKDGRREGIRREYYPHVSNVTKTQEDLSRFRPAGTGFTDYITDFALNPQRKTAKLSDTIVTNSNLYNKFTTDHEFRVARYGEDARRTNLRQRAESRVPATDRENYLDIPGGEYIKKERESKAYKAAGLLMGAIVNQKHQVEQNQTGGLQEEGHGVETMANRKVKALDRDLTVVLREIKTSTDFKAQDQTQVGKTAAPTRAAHLKRVQTESHSQPAHQILNAELMYKSLKPSADVESIRRSIITDDRAKVLREELSVFGKGSRRDMVTGKRNAIMNVDGKSLSTVTYKHTGKRIRNADAKLMAATAENFGGNADKSQVRRPGAAMEDYTNPNVNDVNPDTVRAFHGNHEQAHRAFKRGGDKYGVRRHSTLSHASDDITSES